ncbi:MAG: hypothetical protein GC160_03870 [Acidobacteria bacterium]|nr:hypothetical protein [Acidobacteriota bacterium]
MSALLNSETFAAAYGRGYSLTLRFLTSRGVSGTTAEELAQAAWARGWERRKQLHALDALQVWINRIALNLLLTEVRKQRRLEPLEDYVLPTVPAPNGAAPDASALLGRLSPGDQEVLVLQAVYGLTCEEIGKRCSLSPIGVRVRLHRLKKKLRERVNPRTKLGAVVAARRARIAAPAGVDQVAA